MAVAVAQRNTNSVTFNSSWGITLPNTSAVSGDFYIIILNTDVWNSTTLSTTSTGWTLNKYGTAGCSTWIATGVEGTAASTLTINTSTSGRVAYVGYRVTGADTSGLSVATNDSSAASANRTYPSLTPSGGSKQYLWIITDSANNGSSSGYNPPSAPSGWSNFQEIASTNCNMASAEQITTASSLSGGTWPAATFTASYTDLMIAVAPSSGGGGGSGPITTNLPSGSTSWTVPAGVYQVTAECIGGGAAGGAGQSTFSAIGTGGGGGGGSYSKKLFNVTPGQAISYSTAAAVAGGSGNGANGNTSWFKANDSTGCVAVGGRGGTTASGAQGTGGIGTTTGCYGDVSYRGGNGSSPTFAGSGGGSGSGGGGAGPGGQGGDSPDIPGSQNTPVGGAGQSPGGAGAAGVGGAVGNPGSNYGGGGSGGAAPQSNTYNGGGGAMGLVRVTYSTVTPTTATDSGVTTEASTLGLPRSDTATVVDAVSKLTNAAAETITAQEDAVVHLGGTQDTISAVDSAGSGLLITSSDTIGTWAENTALVGISAPESANTVDSTTNQLYNEVLDQISAADLSALVFGVSDTAAGADSASKLVGINTPASDSASGTESARIGIAIKVSDSASVVESVTDLVIKAPETVNAADSAISVVFKYASDAVIGSESVDTELFPPVFDTFYGSESAQIGLPKGVSDAFSASESAKIVAKGPDSSIFTESASQRLGQLIGERVYYVPPDNRVYLVPDEV